MSPFHNPFSKDKKNNKLIDSKLDGEKKLGGESIKMESCLAKLVLALKSGTAEDIVSILNGNVECGKCHSKFKIGEHTTQPGNYFFKITCPNCSNVTGLTRINKM